MVWKKNEKWRMCTDFTDLSKCCPKDHFPLARIDKIVDSATGCEMMQLLDCFSGYHQIWLRKEDEEKMSFMTPFGTYCYLRMPEDMRNASLTFCRMMKVALKDQVGRKVFSYVDDIVISSKKKTSYISDLTETFANMCEARLGWIYKSSCSGHQRYYSEMEKICYAVVFWSSHNTCIDKPTFDRYLWQQKLLQLNQPWAMELSEHVAEFEKRSAIKSYIIADFVEEWMEHGSCIEGLVPESPWLIYCDGARGSTRAGTAAVLISPSGIKLRYAVRLQFTNVADKCTNNIAEYEAILLGLRKLRANGVQRCVLWTYSKLVSSQIEKECITRELTLKKYLALVRRMQNYFKGFTIEYNERNKNTEADEQVKVTARSTPLPTDVFFQIIEDASAKTVEPEPRLINAIEGEDWRAPIIAYLHHYYEPNNNTELIRMQQRDKAYQIINNELYKTSITCPLLCYLSKAEGQELLSEIHAGVCRGHIGTKVLATKVLR
jgi:ribonuclease HI